MGGTVAWPKKHTHTRGPEENFSLGHTGTGVEGDCHLVTIPPPRGGDRPNIRGGLQGGGGTGGAYL